MVIIWPRVRQGYDYNMVLKKMQKRFGIKKNGRVDKLAYEFTHMVIMEL